MAELLTRMREIEHMLAHQAPFDEVVSVIDAYIAIQPSLVARAQAILAACGTRPELAPRYLDAMIGELEQAAPADPVAETRSRTLTASGDTSVESGRWSSQSACSR